MFTFVFLSGCSTSTVHCTRLVNTLVLPHPGMFASIVTHTVTNTNGGDVGNALRTPPTNQEIQTVWWKIAQTFLLSATFL